MKVFDTIGIILDLVLIVCNVAIIVLTLKGSKE